MLRSRPVVWYTPEQLVTRGFAQAHLAAHQAELMSLAYTNWREAEQARRLVAISEQVPTAAPLLVWCGNGHLTKARFGQWRPMGWHLVRLLGHAPFAIDQAFSVAFPSTHDRPGQRLAAQYADALQAHGGTAGWLTHDLPRWRRPRGVDAVLLSTDNAME